MWIFTPGGLLMPASLPTKAVDKVEVDPKWTNNGTFDLQVRGRVSSHLQNFIRDYMDPLNLAHSDIQHTPKMDYNVRFYCRQVDFAHAVQACVMDIDFLKFKPTAERRSKEGYLMYEDGKAYHSVLNAIWGTVTRLGRPYESYGGSWWGGSAAEDRPKRTYGRPFQAKSRWDDEPRSEMMGDFIEEPTADFVPDSDTQAEELLQQLEGIPHAQWGEFATTDELENLERYLKANDMMELWHPVTETIDQEPIV